jgi:hypothetical protein
VTAPRRNPAEPGPGRRSAGPAAPDPRPSEENLRELREPDDLGIRGFGDGWPQYRPEYAIVIDQIRGTGAPPSLAELLENLAVRTPQPQPEPDLEAEP